jgi:glycine/D-amino acid oxidase-like deaminating enzyme/nitrite reductase/ring-hydroxylating ferredoxin subunit
MHDDGDGTSSSLWMDRSELPKFESLSGDLEADVCIVGAGISGLSVAYRLAAEPCSVVVLDDGAVGGGQTKRTTAHLSWVLDDRFARLERFHGTAATRLAWQSHAAAMDAIERTASTESIDCDLERVDGFLCLGSGDEESALRGELAAMRRAGVEDVEWLERPPVARLEGPCLRFGRQMQLQPLDYLAGLARACARRGVRIFTGTHVQQVEGGSRPRVRARAGCVRAAWAVVATNSPIHVRFALHTKQAAYRSYVVALAIPPGAVPRALYWDTLDPYHYVRLHRGADAELLIVGGEDHRTGAVCAADAERRYASLERWARERFPALGRAAYRWSGQVLEPADGLAFIGATPGEERVLLATGDSGMGMTHGAMAGLLLGDRILGRASPWDELYDPSRKTPRALLELARENAVTAAHYADWLRPRSPAVAGIARGAGAVVRRGARMLAVYREHDDTLCVRSAVCPHLGCLVAWNAAEESWDCPCHGSRFDCHGRVVQGPANADLEAATLDGDGPEAA